MRFGQITGAVAQKHLTVFECRQIRRARLSMRSGAKAVQPFRSGRCDFGGRFPDCGHRCAHQNPCCQITSHGKGRPTCHRAPDPVKVQRLLCGRRSCKAFALPPRRAITTFFANQRDAQRFGCAKVVGLTQRRPDRARITSIAVSLSVGTTALEGCAACTLRPEAVVLAKASISGGWMQRLKFLPLAALATSVRMPGGRISGMPSSFAPLHRPSRFRAQILNDDCADDVALADQESFTQAACLLKRCLWLNARSALVPQLMPRWSWLGAAHPCDECASGEHRRCRAAQAAFAANPMPADWHDDAGAPDPVSGSVGMSTLLLSGIRDRVPRRSGSQAKVPGMILARCQAACFGKNARPQRRSGLSWTRENRAQWYLPCYAPFV